jgi:hypothetical protein
MATENGPCRKSELQVFVIDSSSLCPSAPVDSVAMRIDAIADTAGMVAHG